MNTRSNRAAIQLPTASLMLDDGTIEHRVRLLRPTDEQRFGLDALAETHWQPADRKLFCDLWQAEVAAVPEFTTNTFHIVTVCSCRSGVGCRIMIVRFIGSRPMPANVIIGRHRADPCRDHVPQSGAR